ncbi:MAG: hypothetical protein GPOALKHO_000426 [Sodalis sp.]|nr:MAG: hypothetical protein GPOALKHO_000426 [Sodalis sp.]
MGLAFGMQTKLIQTPSLRSLPNLFAFGYHLLFNRFTRNTYQNGQWLIEGVAL